MIYFKYNSSFRLAKGVEDLDRLKTNQNIERIVDEDNLRKHILKGDSVYCFIDPYCEVVDEEIVLNWTLSEDSALDLWYSRKEDI